MRPKTLLELAGLSPAPSPLSQAALVVIDAQREYVDGRLPLPGVQAALGEIAALLARARRAGAPIIHVQHRGRPGGAFGPDTPGFAIAAEAAPRPGERVIEKGLPNAFAGTELKAALDALGRKEIVLAGFMTHMCVEATARAATDLGLKATVVASATATRDLPDPLTGATVPAAEVHRNALAALNDRFAVVVGDATGIAD
ncbi:MAG: cysteine hydrolase [Pseudorhodoplanes sp.]|nr:MAG: cysteine hydrolase [Pseudorhodoplanes sp.]MBZ0138730.1 cysteine hydrolase [Pseudorhodoplanes sp.]